MNVVTKWKCTGKNKNHSDAENPTEGEGINEDHAEYRSTIPLIYLPWLRFIKLIISKAILLVIRLRIAGSSEIRKVKEKKEMHIRSRQIMDKLLKRAKSYYEQEEKRNKWLSQYHEDEATSNGNSSCHSEYEYFRRGHGPSTPILIAASNGIVEMVEKTLQDLPLTIHDKDFKRKNIVLLAVENRQSHLYDFLLKSSHLLLVLHTCTAPLYCTLSSSLGSGPAAAVVKKFHTGIDHCPLHHRCEYCSDFIFEVPLRSSSADLHIRGYLAAIGDHTRPHAPLKDSAAPPRASTSCHSSGSTINLSSTELQEIIAQAVRMAGNASFSTALSVLPGSEDGVGAWTGPRVGRMFPVNNLHLPHVAPVSVAAATAAVSSLPSLALWHSRLGHAPSSRVQQLVSRGTSHQNGRAERKLRHILDTVRALLLSAKIPAPFWGEASLHVVHAINRIPSAVIHNQTPYERLFGSPPNYHHLRSFGSACFVLLQPHEHNKLEPRSRLCCFLGYGETQREIFPDESIVPSTNTFDPHLDFSPDIFDVSPRQVADEQINHSYPTLSLGSLAPALPEDPPQDIPPRHSTRIAMKEELDALTKNHTWDLVTLPPGQSVVGCKWIYKIKTRSDGSVERYKARLVAKGFTQEYGIDYEETFAPVARISSVRALLAVAAARKWDLFQMDVKNAFLNGDLSEEVYMQPPTGLSVESNKVCHLRRALYGLKQAPRVGTILLLLYVDDMTITGDDLSGIQELKDFLNQQFEMKDLGHLSYFLGLEITHSTDGLYITQAKYASDLLSQAGLTDSKTVDTPVELNAHLTPSGGKPLSNPSLYRRLVGSLVYLTVTRPDISYDVHQVSQYLSAPRSTHYADVLRILRYLKGTLFHSLFYSAQSPLVLRAFSDADWAGDPTDRRSTTGYCFLLGSSLISWRSKKQTFVARSSTEAEYRALADTTSELLWLRWLLKDLGVSTSFATPLYCDSAIHIAHNDVFHERTKHIEIDCHFIRYHLIHGALKLFSVSSKDQLADIFTKSLPKRRTRDLVDNLNDEDLALHAVDEDGSDEDLALHAVDEDGNSALHLAAELKNYESWLIPSSTLPMHWEVKWYEGLLQYVKKSLRLNVSASSNRIQKTPDQIFTETHKEPLEKSKEWLNSTCNSCSFIAALIATAGLH
ncbi:Retrovirus-related Pol polyprotein from transposon RE1 [Vitis vinifera]|uniref:Retrovirus-related Pol polyprotein from transposon RE1 n=1 Tax=Vitis vinifera TaxID=29760 RepID=A0A438BS46_VITVI|nr:Retrovirus-related Pol polyprotein from transposon RE1 [Vitis vinifera]